MFVEVRAWARAWTRFDEIRLLDATIGRHHWTPREDWRPGDWWTHTGVLRPVETILARAFLEYGKSGR